MGGQDKVEFDHCSFFIDTSHVTGFWADSSFTPQFIFCARYITFCGTALAQNLWTEVQLFCPLRCQNINSTKCYPLRRRNKWRGQEEQSWPSRCCYGNSSCSSSSCRSTSGVTEISPQYSHSLLLLKPKKKCFATTSLVKYFPNPSKLPVHYWDTIYLLILMGDQLIKISIFSAN